jgi:hypothetical protein
MLGYLYRITLKFQSTKWRLCLLAVVMQWHFLHEYKLMNGSQSLINSVSSLKASSHKSISVLALVILLPTARTVPFHRSGWKLLESNTLHVKPHPDFALF